MLHVLMQGLSVACQPGDSAAAAARDFPPWASAELRLSRQGTRWGRLHAPCLLLRESLKWHCVSSWLKYRTSTGWERLCKEETAVDTVIRKFLLPPVPACGGLSSLGPPFPSFLFVFKERERKVEAHSSFAGIPTHLLSVLQHWGRGGRMVKTARLYQRRINNTPNMESYFQRSGKL